MFFNCYTSRKIAFKRRLRWSLKKLYCLCYKQVAPMVLSYILVRLRSESPVYSQSISINVAPSEPPIAIDLKAISLTTQARVPFLADQ
jgi:hypothetical protein